MPTNVDPDELNYDSYETEKYDQDIIRSIPGHKKLHESVDGILENIQNCSKVLELGVGTGLTSELVLKRFPNSKYCAVDFSETMLEGARKRLANYDVDFIQGDYSVVELPRNNDAVVSVVGIHHQETDADKKRLFQRVYDSLSIGGSFIFGDLVTYRDSQVAISNDALHYHHLVENAQDEKSLKEWLHHHKYLNRLAPLEDQVDWLQDVGFKQVDVVFKKYNTVLISAIK